jgi:subtilisin family serine protease
MANNINPELELALSVNNYSRYNSLYIGYNSILDTWQLIIRYTGDISDLEGTILKSIIYLLGNFAVIEIETAKIEILRQDFRIVYIDKPNYYSYGDLRSQYQDSTMDDDNYFSKYTSCIGRGADKLSGMGVCIAIIDTEIDLTHPEFFKDGKCRFVAYWNQNTDYDDSYPNKYKLGRIYESRKSKELCNIDNLNQSDISTHGTEVASLSGGSNVGVAYEAELLGVALNSREETPDTIAIMMAIDYAVNYSIENNLPMVINLSYGNNYGAHDGTNILELFIDYVSTMSKLSVVTGTGNDGTKGLHTSGILGNVSYEDIEINVSKGVKSFGLQIWKNFADIFDVLVFSPSNELVMYLSRSQIETASVENYTRIYGIYQSPTPYNQRELIYISFSFDIQRDSSWIVRLMPKSIVNGVYNAYLPGDSFVTGQVSFAKNTEYGTLTIPSTASSIVSVSAYNQNNNSLAGFSGRGFASDGAIKPDIGAPGVYLTVAIPGESYTKATGTSLASAFTAGAAALLMEWGIVRGNDPYLYGEKLKAYLHRDARRLFGISKYPNPQLGYGTLCVLAKKL